MVRSMFSGVAGMKAHQTRMDVIGNNIANVNTYGFKSSRATFRDVYYQTTRSAAEGSGNRGGLNPSQVGYGSTIGSIDVLQTQSTMSTTGNPLDIAITGEGFLQVQDADGNIFYTKAGMLDIDSYGNLVDVNGNFVLGVSGSPVGQAPGSKRITFNIPAVNPAASSAEDTINGLKYTVTTSNNTTDGNVKFTINSSTELSYGEKVRATVTSGGVNILLNANEKFSSMDELNTAINAAIKSANGGAEHPAGTFTIKADNEDEVTKKFGTTGLTGAQIAGRNYGVDKGSLTVPALWDTLFGITEVGDGFTGKDGTIFNVEHSVVGDPTATPPTDDIFEFTVTTANSVTYKATLTGEQMKNPGKVLLKNATGTSDDTITMSFPTQASMLSKLAQKDNTTADGYARDADGKYILGYEDPANPGTWITTGSAGGDATPSTEARDLGFSEANFKLVGGTKGGPQTVKDLSGISIGSDGVITAIHPTLGEIEVGRIDLATFDNPAGLEQNGNTYFVKTANSGDPHLAEPGTNGTGLLAQSALESSNVDLSQEFADMITTQRGFQANSRLITVSDTMLEELINLKR